MQSPISPRQAGAQRREAPRRPGSDRARGFTLIELLVAIGIIALLAGILLPMILRSMKQGSRTRTQADLNTIAIALEAYKADFGDYPRLPVFTSGPNAGQTIPDTGAATLGKALIGPYGDGLTSTGIEDADDPPAFSTTKDYKPGHAVRVGSGPGAQYYVCIATTTPGASEPVSDTNFWAWQFSPLDGLDGPGAKARVGGGRTYGPYLKPENFKMTGLALGDREGNPILYFPATPGHPNVNKAYGYVERLNRTIAPARVPLYNADDNMTIFQRPGEPDERSALTRIQCVAGDYSGSNYASAPGAIDANFGWGQDTAFAGNSFILWTAGPDGLFGPTNVINNVTSTPDWNANLRVTEKCDDVTNFR